MPKTDGDDGVNNMENTQKTAHGGPLLTRRNVLALVGAGTLASIGAGVGIWKLNTSETVPAPARPSFPRAAQTGRVQAYTLEALPAAVTIGGTHFSTWTYNGKLPGPEIRVMEGDTLRVTVKNRLPDNTTIHWHGVPLVNAMDGVDGVTQKPIQAGHDFTYEFVAPTAGTYFYHSHVGLQLDRGLYGPLVIEERHPANKYDQDVVLVLDDWLDGVPGGPGNPEAELKQLIAGGDNMPGMGGMGNMGDMSGMNGNSTGGMNSGNMMSAQVPPDVMYPLYVINGKSSTDPFELTVSKGQRIRVRLINASSSTIYHLALQGHRMTVTHTDGQPVQPVEVDALRIGMGERYDVLLHANNPGAWQLAAQVEGAKQMVRAIVRYQGVTAANPPIDFVPEELSRQMLDYRMLTVAPGTFTLPAEKPDVTIPIQLSGGMGQYVWRINNQVFPKADQIVLSEGRLIRFQFENQSMMPHPMHLHGHFFQLDNGTGKGPLKDTVIVEPMQRLTVNWISDNPGKWAFHCHNAYHMATGMMRIIKVGA
jgi:Putative multicopper oxidases